MKYKAVIFDLDGTLLDTLGDLAESLNRILEAEGFPTHTVEKFRYFLGYGALVLVQRALPPDRRDDDDFVQDILVRFRKDYSNNWNVLTRPYDGIPEMLDGLAGKDIKLAVLSNKPHHFVELCVKEYLSAWKFDFILGQRDGDMLKPDPSGALDAAGRMGFEPERVIFLGDSGIDMQTAGNADMYAVGALWGYRDEQELMENGADRIIAHPLDLLGLL